MQHSHQLETSELKLIIGDNSPCDRHAAGYNGLWQITSVHDERPLFVPDYCGMNFEYIVPVSAANMTEPRNHPTELIVDDKHCQVTLHQKPTPTHHLESWMTYRAAGPCHVDWTFRYHLHDAAAFPAGLAGFFFANYIHQPENKAIYLLSRDAYDSLMWIQFCTTAQGRESAVVWESDSYNLTDFGPDDWPLYTSRAPIRYTVPLMLGRRGEMAFVLMFENPHGVVISHGMGGGGFVHDRSDRHPAWDFFLYVNAPAAQPQGQWKARIVYKKFLGRDDILVEYQNFQRDLGHNWAIPSYGPQE